MSAILLLLLSVATLVGMYFGYFINVIGRLHLLFPGLAMVHLAPVQVRRHPLFISAGADQWPRPEGY